MSCREQELIAHVQNSIAAAEEGTSKLDRDVLEIEGKSSAKVRHLLNHLCSASNTSYLEIGCWKGATWIAALYGNQANVSEAIAIDNWSQFGSCEEFQENCSKFLYRARLGCVNLDSARQSKIEGSEAPDLTEEHHSQIEKGDDEDRFGEVAASPNSHNLSGRGISSQYPFYSTDCFSLPLGQVFKKPVNIYFYDGEHSALAHEKAFTYYHEVLDSVFVAIVDDWNWDRVQQGTRTAFDKLKFEVLFERALPASCNCDKEQWWNGVYVAVIRKV